MRRGQIWPEDEMQNGRSIFSEPLSCLGQGHDAILSALSPSDENAHAFSINIMNGEAERFGKTKPAGVYRLQVGTMAQFGGVFENLPDLISIKHPRQRFFLGGLHLFEDRPFVLEHNSKKLAKSANEDAH